MRSTKKTVSLFQSHVFKHEFFLFPVASEFPLNFIYTHSNMSDPNLNQNSLKTDPAIRKFLARIHPQVAATFTNSQLAELKRVFNKRLATPPRVDIRLSIPFFKRRFYLVLIIGKDKPDKQR